MAELNPVAQLPQTHPAWFATPPQLQAGQYFGSDGSIWQTQNTDSGDQLVSGPWVPPDVPGSSSILYGWSAGSGNTDSGPSGGPAIPLAGLVDDRGTSLLASLGYTGGGYSSGNTENSQAGPTAPGALAYLVGHGIDVRQSEAPAGTVTLGGRAVDSIIQGFDSSGQRIGVAANVGHVNDDAFGVFALGATAFAAAAAVGASAAIDGAATSTGGASSSAAAWSAPSVAGPAVGNGAFLGEGIASGVPAWDAAANAAGLSLTSPAAFAIDAAPSSSSSLASTAAKVGSAVPAASSSSSGGLASLLAPGGALNVAGQVAGLASTIGGLVSQLTGGAPSSPAAQLAAQQSAAAAAAAQRQTLLLIVGAVALVLVLRK